MIAFFLISASHKATKGILNCFSTFPFLPSSPSCFMATISFYRQQLSTPYPLVFRSPTSRTCNTGSSHCTICFQRFHRTFHHFCNSFAAYCSMFSKVSADTCSKDIFISLEYATILPLKYSELPGTEVIRAAIPPPVQLSAVERDNFFAFSSSPTFLPTSYLIIYYPKVTRE